MTSFLKNIATFSNLLFIAAVALGIVLPQGAFLSFFLTLPALTVILTVTLLCYPRGFFRQPRKLIPAALLGNLMNYFILGNLIIMGSIFLIRDEKIWVGMVLVAAMPSAVCILSLSEKILTDQLLTLGGVAGTYAAAVILIPLIGIAFLKFIPISYTKLIVLALSLIGLPLIFSRMAVDRNWENHIRSRAGQITDWCYFIIYYTLAARNADLIKKWPVELLLISAIAIAAIILVHVGFLMIRRVYKFDDRYLSPLLLLGTMKNYGLAGVIGLYVFRSEAALPALIFSIFLFLHCIWLKFRAGRPAPGTLSNSEHITE